MKMRDERDRDRPRDREMVEKGNSRQDIDYDIEKSAGGKSKDDKTKKKDDGRKYVSETDYVGLSFSFAAKIMGASACFFLVERSSCGVWAHSVTIAGIVCGVAWWNYCYMKEAWVARKTAPKTYRYLDWFITVPLQVLEFYMILVAVTKVSPFLMVRFEVVTFFMLISGYCGETGKIDVWMGFAFSILCWFYVIYEIFLGEAAEASADSESKACQLAFNGMRLILLVGWSLYPFGYCYGHINGEECKIKLNTAYNIADVVNKCGFGLCVYVAAQLDNASHRALSPDDWNQFHI